MKPLIGKIKPEVDYQGIGGQDIIIDRQLTVAEAGKVWNYATVDFFDRRPDLCKPSKDNEIVYYGHVYKKSEIIGEKIGLGYLVAADELDGELREMPDDYFKKSRPDIRAFFEGFKAALRAKNVESR